MKKLSYAMLTAIELSDFFWLFLILIVVFFSIEKNKDEHPKLYARLCLIRFIAWLIRICRTVSNCGVRESFYPSTFIALEKM